MDYIGVASTKKKEEAPSSDLLLKDGLWEGLRPPIPDPVADGRDNAALLQTLQILTIWVKTSDPVNGWNYSAAQYKHCRPSPAG